MQHENIMSDADFQRIKRIFHAMLRAKENGRHLLARRFAEWGQHEHMRIIYPALEHQGA